MRALIYTRLSRDRPDEASTARQEADCRSLCAAKGYDVAGVHTDLLSGYRKGVRRPGYEAVLAAVRAREVDVIVIWKLDRLTRQGVREIGPLLDLLEVGQTRLVSVQDSIDTSTAMGEGILAMLASIAKQESENISTRTRRAKEQGAIEGRVPGGGSRPFGYLAGGLLVDEDEAELVREAGARLLAGETARSICADWEARGVKTPTGRTFRDTSLRQMLGSARLRGMRSHHGEEVGKAVWPAIFDEVTGKRVAAAASYSGTRGPQPRAYLLTGIIVCGRCGAKLLPKRRHPSGVRTYCCLTMPGRDGCGRLRIEAVAVEELVARQIVAAVSVGRFASSNEPPSAGNVDDAAVIETGEAQLVALAEEWALGGLTLDAWRGARATIDAHLAAARRRQAGRSRAGIVSPYLREPALLANQWPGMALVERREVVDAAVAAVRVAPATRMGRPFDTSRVAIDWR